LDIFGYFSYDLSRVVRARDLLEEEEGDTGRRKGDLKHGVMCIFQFRKSHLIYEDLGLLVIFVMKLQALNLLAL